MKNELDIYGKSKFCYCKFPVKVTYRNTGENLKINA